MLSAIHPLLVAALVLGLVGDTPLRAQPAEPDLAGTWNGPAVLMNDWPGFTCHYEGAESPPAVQLELAKDGGQWTGSVAIDVAPAEGSGCPPLRKRYAIPAVHAEEGSVSFTDSGGNEWNLALRHGEGLLKGLMAWKTGDESLASGFKAPSGATPLTRLSGEVKLQRAPGDRPVPGNNNITSGASCGTTPSGVALLGVCDGTSLPCQSGFSCNRGFCEDRSGACPF